MIMNKLESIIYNIVRGNPALKLFLRNVYQSIFDLLPRKKESLIGKYQYRENYFFGFHDISPISMDDTKMLANHTLFDLRMPRKSEPLEIGYFDLNGEQIANFHKIGESFAWNYHKGCRLQWIDESHVIYNTAVDGKSVGKIVNIVNRKEQIVKCPIDAIYAKGMIATSFSYERLDRCMPGYGYSYTDEGYLDEDVPQKTGLFLVNLRDNAKMLLLSLRKIAEAVPVEFHSGYIHFVTHSEFSSDGRYISFLHRWVSRSGDYKKRWTRIMVYDRYTEELITLPSQVSGSHYVWNERNQIIASCIIDNHSCHVLFDLDDVDNYKIIAGNILNSDGHQSFITDTSFVTDTYPDKYRMAKLYKVDIPSETVELLASFYSPKLFQTRDFKCHIACDLHPRVSFSKKYLCWDSPRTGKRGIYLMKL